MDVPVRSVQSIRERFESNGALLRPESEPESHSVSSLSSSTESDQGSTGTGGFQPHNRTSIKRSPAFRTGQKALEPAKKNPLRRSPALSPEPPLTGQMKKPSLRRKPGVTRTSKPNLETIIAISSYSDPLIEQALRAPLPTGPAPKKPPRTFQYDAYIMEQQKSLNLVISVNSSTETETEASPQRPARRKSSQQRVKNGNPTKQYTMSRSKTEPFLLGRKKSADDEASVEDLRHSPLDEHVWNKDSRWLNPVQWNTFTPAPSDSKNPKSPRLYSSMLSIAGGDHQPASHQSGQYQVRRMSCDFAERRRLSDFRPPCSLPVVGHVYDEPSSKGDLHYMCSPIVEVGEYNSWNVQRVIGEDSDDADSEHDVNKTSQMVEDRKIYVRRVSSNVCDLKRASRTPMSVVQQRDQHQLHTGGLYEIFLEVALYYDRNSQRHTPYIKSCYPNQASVPPGVELFCFPDSAHWPPPVQTAADPYTIVLTDSKGDRLYGYCRRVVPEGSLACIPITYCLLSRHRAAGFYNKVLNSMASKHGVSVNQRTALLECLHKQPFPNPGRFVELPPDVSGSSGKSGKIQRLLDGRLEDNDLRVLFERLNETVILHVLGTILLERKLIFVSQNLGVLSLCIDAVQSMLYPFVWQHTLVPVLPHSMTEIASAPTPFVLGMLSRNVDDWKAIQPDQGMLVDLDSGKVLHSVGDESTILPRRSVRKLMADWEVTVNITQQAESARNALYSESFLRMFVDLCGHYEQHVHSTDSGQKYFEKAVFIRNHSNSGVRDFLEWFTETATFNLFIESRLRRDARPTLFEHKILEHSMQIVRPNAQPILPNSKVLGRKIKTIGDKLREMNMFS